MIPETVVIFGAFDGIHEGHRKFICEAKKQGNKLVAIIARDDMVKELKNEFPKNNELKRLDTVMRIKEIDLALLGDEEKGVYNILKKIKPQIVFLGYDQQNLYNSIHEKIVNGSLPKIDLIFGKPYKPKEYHSSILNK